MSVDNTSKTSFFQRIGNWWNKNGNTVGKGMQIAGTTAMGVGVTGMFIDAMNKPASIFGGCCSPFGFMGMGNCCSPYGMMGMGNSLFGFGGCSTSMAANMGYQYGAMIAMQENMMSGMQMQQGGLNQYTSLATNPYMQNYMNANPYLQNFSTTNPYSFNFSTDAISSANTETETDSWSNKKVDFKGSKLKDGEGNSEDGGTIDAKTDSLGLKKIKQITISDKEDEESIKSELIQTGKNIVANLDSDDDGYVDINEYIANESSKSKYNGTTAKRAFSKMDLNNDNKLDWTELAAIYGTFTTSSEDDSFTNKITQNNYNKWSAALGDTKDNKVIKRMTNIREKLVDSSDS